MTDQELEILLTERVETLGLKKRTYDLFVNILADNADDEEFFRGYNPEEIIPEFDGYEYDIERRRSGTIIRTRIGLYVKSQDIDDIEPIGYCELETNLNGDWLDDWFVIEKEKYVYDIGMIAHIQNMNAKLPIEYLNRSHVHYEFVSYLSMVGTLFVSKQFESAGQSIMSAYRHIETVDAAKFDKDHLWEAKSFLKMIGRYLATNDLVTDHLKKELNEK